LNLKIKSTATSLSKQTSAMVVVQRLASVLRAFALPSRSNIILKRKKEHGALTKDLLVDVITEE
jgi:hypothetical protein